MPSEFHNREPPSLSEILKAVRGMVWIISGIAQYPAEYPETLKQPLKIGGYVDTQSPVTTYLHIHLVNIFKIIVTT